MRLLCQICGENIGEISLEGVEQAQGRPGIDALKSPLKGSMVGSPDPFHDFPAPFDPEATWEFMYCPFSRRTHWPFENTGTEPKQLLTHKGMIDIPDSIEYTQGEKNVSLSDCPATAEDKQDDKQPTVSNGVLDQKCLSDVPHDEEEEGQAIGEAAPSPKQPEEPEFICTKCGKSFETLRKMNSHQSAHKKGK